MKLSEKDTKLIRTFVHGQLCDEPDLSILTIRILKKRYLAHVQGDTLSPEAKSFMKQVVQEEILKMQDNDNSEGEVDYQKAQRKRKRTSELLIDKEHEFVAKKSRQSPSLSESKDKADSVTIEEENTEAQSHSESDDKKQGMNKRHRQSKVQESSQESIDEDENGIEVEKNGGNTQEEVDKSKADTLKDSSTARKIQSHEKEGIQSDKNSEGNDVSEKSEKLKTATSSDESDKENLSERKIKDDTDSDSSSLRSLESEDDKRKKNEKKKMEGKKHNEGTKKSDRGQKDEHKSVVRLKRFISLCGVRRNYKKLLHGCHSVRSQVAVLKKELEDLGVHGKPSVEKCKKIRMKREEAQEIAELDVNNIISTQGRSKRRGASVLPEQQEPPSSTYARALNSGSDTDEENKMKTGYRRTTDWSNLRGIISDDAESD